MQDLELRSLLKPQCLELCPRTLSVCWMNEWSHLSLRAVVQSTENGQFSQFSSVAQSCPTLCDPMDCSTPGLPVHHQLRSLLRLMSIELVMPSSHLILSSPVAYWAPTHLGSSSFSVLSFCLFILFMEFSRQEYWSGLPFPSSVDHILSELSTMTLPSWVALHGMAHSFLELDKVVVHVISFVSFYGYLLNPRTSVFTWKHLQFPSLLDLLSVLSFP